MVILTVSLAIMALVFFMAMWQMKARNRQLIVENGKLKMENDFLKSKLKDTEDIQDAA